MIKQYIEKIVKREMDKIKSKIFKKEKDSGASKSIFNIYPAWDIQTLEERIEKLERNTDLILEHFKLKPEHKKFDKWVLKKTK